MLRGGSGRRAKRSGTGRGSGGPRNVNRFGHWPIRMVDVIENIFFRGK